MLQYFELQRLVHLCIKTLMSCDEILIFCSNFRIKITTLCVAMKDNQSTSRRIIFIVTFIFSNVTVHNCRVSCSMDEKCCIASTIDDFRIDLWAIPKKVRVLKQKLKFVVLEKFLTRVCKKANVHALSLRME